MRVLVVEDDRKIAAFVRKGLEAEGFAVDHAENGEDAFHFALHVHYEVAVVDLMLPLLGGLDLIARLRTEGMKAPVLILSAQRSVMERVRGLECGADDYLTKPFAFAELLARVRVLMRRPGDGLDSSHLRAADLVLDATRHTVERAGHALALRPREFALLEYLLRNKGRVVSKALIIEAVWSYEFAAETDVVDVLVCRLRAKVDRGFAEPLIHTLRGVGYVLKSSH